MLVKLLFAPLYHPTKPKQHRNSRLLLLSTFLPHNLNLHQLLLKKRKQRVPPFLGEMLQKGAALQEFQKDITRAFSSRNVPLEKLGHVEMKEFFAK